MEDLLEIGAVLVCGGNPVCAIPVAFASTTFVAGVTSGNLGYALKAGFIAAVTAAAFYEVGAITEPSPGFGTAEYFEKVAGSALIGCASAVASDGKCGAGALAAGVSAAAGAFMNGADRSAKLVMSSVVGGLASVAGGGKFANGAVTGAFGYLFSPQADDEGDDGAYGSARKGGRGIGDNGGPPLDDQNLPGGYTPNPLAQAIVNVVAGVGAVVDRIFGPAPDVAPRPLTEADLGLSQGSLQELRGTYSVMNRTATVQIDMIQGTIRNPFSFIDSLSTTALQDGAQTLNIQGTIANERLFNILSSRYGMTSRGAIDTITVSLR